MQRSAGNALFLILIAVALFAALSYAVTQSGRGGGGIDRENRALLAANIVTYAANMRSVIQRMAIINGVADNQYRFVNNNTNCATTDCQVFNAAGGGASNIAPNAELLDSAWSAETTYGQWVYNGGHNVTGVGTTTGDATGSELIAVLPWLRKDICLEINNRLGVTNPSGDAPVDAASYSPSPFIGTYGTSEIGDAAGHLTGKDAACFKATNVGGDAKPNSYHFYQVLKAR